MKRRYCVLLLNRNYTITAIIVSSVLLHFTYETKVLPKMHMHFISTICGHCKHAPDTVHLHQISYTLIIDYNLKYIKVQFYSIIKKYPKSTLSPHYLKY